MGKSAKSYFFPYPLSYDISRCINWSEMGWAPYAINKWGFPEPGEDEEAAATGSADKPIGVGYH